MSLSPGPPINAYLPLFKKVICDIFKIIAQKIQVASHDTPDVEDVSPDNLESRVLCDVPA
jgi:hypothetical protein